MSEYLQALQSELARARDPQHIADVQAEIERVTGKPSENRRAVPAARTRRAPKND